MATTFSQNTTQKPGKNPRIDSCIKQLKNITPRENCIVFTCTDPNEKNVRELELKFTGGSDTFGVMLNSMLKDPEIKRQPGVWDALVVGILMALKDAGVSAIIK